MCAAGIAFVNCFCATTHASSKRKIKQIIQIKQRMNWEEEIEGLAAKHAHRWCYLVTIIITHTHTPTLI